MVLSKIGKMGDIAYIIEKIIDIVKIIEKNR